MLVVLGLTQVPALVVMATNRIDRRSLWQSMMKGDMMRALYSYRPRKTYQFDNKSVYRGRSANHLLEIPRLLRATGDSQATQYPSLLPSQRARTSHGGYTTTDILGYLSDDHRQPLEYGV